MPSYYSRYLPGGDLSLPTGLVSTIENAILDEALGSRETARTRTLDRFIRLAAAKRATECRRALRAFATESNMQFAR